MKSKIMRALSQAGKSEPLNWPLRKSSPVRKRCRSPLAMFWLTWIILAAPFGLLGSTAAPLIWGQTTLRINQLQLLGTHNSYRLAPDEVARQTIGQFAADQVEALDYSHRPLAEQLQDLGVRHFEFDLFLDPKGNRYSNPLGYAMAAEQGIAVPPFDPQGLMKKPGIKVLHSPDFDYRTQVYTLVDGLKQLKMWSDANPRHVPIFVLLELKANSFSPTTRALPWNRQGFLDLEEEILSVIPVERILKPDDIQGKAASLRESVLNIGWPAVETQRGKFVFLLDNEGKIRDQYLSIDQLLQNRLLFVSVDRQHPAAAWMKRNDPVASFDEIKSLVSEGFLVRTRADVDTRQARTNDTKRREAAIASGAQLISTDYPQPDLRWSDYHVLLVAPDESP